jgi:hypothetical protein
VRSDGASLTINSWWDAGRAQWFVDNTTNGDWVRFGLGAAEYVAPEYWGADPTGVADSTDAFEQAIECIKNSVLPADNRVQPYLSNAPGGKYVLTGGLFPGQASGESGVYRWDGNASQMTFDISGTDGICLDYTGKHNYQLSNILIIGGTTNPPRTGILQSRRFHGASSAGQAKFTYVNLQGTFLKYGIYNYASEGAHYIDCTWQPICQNVIVITRSNYYSETIPKQNGTLATESCIEFLFDRCNILNNTLAADVDTDLHSCMTLECAGMVFVNHCEIHDLDTPIGSDTMPLVRIATEYLANTNEVFNIVFDTTNFHSSYDTAVLLSGAGDIRNLKLRSCRFNSTTADIKAADAVRLHNFECDNLEKMDLSATGAGLYENNIVKLAPAADVKINGVVKGIIYRQTDSTLTFDTPALVNAKIINIDTAGEFTGSIVWDPGSLASGGTELSAAITVTGAKVGMAVTVYPPYNLQAIMAQGYVVADNMVRIALYNTGLIGTVNLVSGTWKVRCSLISGELT